MKPVFSFIIHILLGDMSKGIGKNIKVRADQVAFIVSLVKRLSTDIVVIIIFVYKASTYCFLHMDFLIYA